VSRCRKNTKWALKALWSYELLQPLFVWINTHACLHNWLLHFKIKVEFTFFEKGLPLLIFNVEKKKKINTDENRRWKDSWTNFIQQQPSTIPATFRLSATFFYLPIPWSCKNNFFPRIAKTGVVVSQCHRRNDSLTGKAKSSSRGSLDSSRK